VSPSDALSRVAILTSRVAADTLRAATGGVRRHDTVWDDGLDEAIRWLCRSHDAVGRRGSSRGYSLVYGWAPAFPETTGYIIGTLLAYGLPRARTDLLARAREMAEWEIEVQGEDGGVMQGLITSTPKRTIAFNTGMVVHGWLDLHRSVGDEGSLEAAVRGGRFLSRHQDSDGAWRGEHAFHGIAHAYHSRVAWALLRLAEATGDTSFRDAAVRNLDWVLSLQRPNGWFDERIFVPGRLPNTHGIAYTLRGLLESYVLIADPRYLDAVRRTAGVLIEKLRAIGFLPAVWDSSWTPRVRYDCLTGTAQLGGIWLRLHQVTGEPAYLRAGLEAVEHAASHQLRTRSPQVRGALPGSFPVYGGYDPLTCPNWATKFLADSLMIRERVLTRRRSEVAELDR
jgi:rhamnogalacturonyl hydrolase YesR